jgi:sugar phosphate isomerase/epimerase
MAFNVEFYCPRWGSENIDLPTFMRSVKTEGYAGVEYAIPNAASQKDLDGVFELAAQFGLKIIPQFYEPTLLDFNHHYNIFENWFEKLKGYPVAKINSQTGRDYFCFEQNKILIDFTLAFQASTGIETLHETHRQKCLFAAHIAKDYLQKIPELKVTLDASHWVCVSESYLADQTEAMDLAISRAGHIHARVGHPQGPQVSDPRAAEWSSAVQIHLNWWKAIANRFMQAEQVLTITPEFGPVPYMSVCPYTKKPLINQRQINLYMMNLLWSNIFE